MFVKLMSTTADNSEPTPDPSVSSVHGFYHNFDHIGNSKSLALAVAEDFLTVPH